MTAACPYCRATFESEDERISCEACATPHHADCYLENGGCTVFGCPRAPVDEPKISISAADVANPARPDGAATSPMPTPPPPRGPSTGVPPPPILRTLSESTTQYVLPEPHLSFAGYAEPRAVRTNVPIYIRRRSRLTFILLGVFFGAFGGHNFYAGYTKRAVIQLLITVLTCSFGGIISWIWAIVEICTIMQDDDGVAFI